MSSIFDYLGGILFSKRPWPTKTVEEEKTFDIFMVNRWCSMVDKDSARLVNETTNKFGHLIDGKEKQYNFLKTVLPKYKYKRINYIKRKTVE